MKGCLNIEQVRDLIRQRRIFWKRHALERMLERGLTRSIALDVLLHGELIEDYTEDRPFPGGLFLGWHGSQPLHVVVAMDTDEKLLAVITAYQPTVENFEPDFRTRRKP